MRSPGCCARAPFVAARRTSGCADCWRGPAHAGGRPGPRRGRGAPAAARGRVAEAVAVLPAGRVPGGRPGVPGAVRRGAGGGRGAGCPTAAAALPAGVAARLSCPALAPCPHRVLRAADPRAPDPPTCRAGLARGLARRLAPTWRRPPEPAGRARDAAGRAVARPRGRSSAADGWARSTSAVPGRLEEVVLSADLDGLPWLSRLARGLQAAVLRRHPTDRGGRAAAPSWWRTAEHHGDRVERCCLLSRVPRCSRRAGAARRPCAPCGAPAARRRPAAPVLERVGRARPCARRRLRPADPRSGWPARQARPWGGIALPPALAAAPARGGRAVRGCARPGQAAAGRDARPPSGPAGLPRRVRAPAWTAQEVARPRRARAPARRCSSCWRCTTAGRCTASG